MQQPIRSKGILLSTNEKTEKLHKFKIKDQADRFSVKFKSALCGCRYKTIGIKGIQTKVPVQLMCQNLKIHFADGSSINPSKYMNRKNSH